MTSPALIRFVSPGAAGKIPLSREHISLFCFAHAGGGASAYRQWPELLRPSIDVVAAQLAGRENRFNEPARADMAGVVSELAEAILPRINGPYMLFGHSLGALLAFEIAHELRGRAGAELLCLFVSACDPPQQPSTAARLADLPNSEFIAEVMRRYGGIPAEILRNVEYLAAILPAMRADFGILESYTYHSRPPLSCPIHGFAGAEDAQISAESMAGWARQTSGLFALEVLPGDHFFLQSQRHALCRSILDSCTVQT